MAKEIIKAKPPLTSTPPAQPDPWGALRALRNMMLSQLDGLRFKHQDEYAMGKPSTLTSEQFSELLVYIQALRDVPQNSPDPTKPNWPQKPQIPGVT